jgi:DNA-binding Lrp family transcriptional regulator
MTAELDQIDRAILTALQRDSRLSMAELGEKVGLSSSACHRRVLQLQTAGVIEGYAARLNDEEVHRQIAHMPGVSRIESKLILRTVKKWMGYKV